MEGGAFASEMRFVGLNLSLTLNIAVIIYVYRLASPTEKSNKLVTL